MIKIYNAEIRKVTQPDFRFSILLLGLIAFLLTSLSAISQNIGINDTGAPPDESAMLDVNATDRGFLMPRLTAIQRDGIINPTVGLQIFNLDSDCIELYFGTGRWEAVKCGFTCGGLLTDSRDSKIYQTVQIGTQCWMAENLNYTPGSGNSWCYNDDHSNCATYGRLYDWATTMNGAASSNSNPSGVQGVCPNG